MVGDLAGDDVGFCSANLRSAAITSSSPFLAAIASNSTRLASAGDTHISGVHKLSSGDMLDVNEHMWEDTHLQTLHLLPKAKRYP